jgi:hypothetical protein
VALISLSKHHFVTHSGQILLCWLFIPLPVVSCHQRWRLSCHSGTHCHITAGKGAECWLACYITVGIAAMSPRRRGWSVDWPVTSQWERLPHHRGGGGGGLHSANTSQYDILFLRHHVDNEAYSIFTFYLFQCLTWCQCPFSLYCAVCIDSYSFHTLFMMCV